MGGRLLVPLLLAIVAAFPQIPWASATTSSTVLLAASTPSTAPRPPWKGLPARTATRSGIPGDPINIGFEGARQQIINAFKAIGWLVADPLSARNDAHLAEAAVLRRHYLTAPVSNLYLLGRPEDFAVEHEIGTISRRDHARLWDTGRKDMATGLELWIGDASRDIAVKVLFRHHIPVGTTHRIDANVDAERNLIVDALRTAGDVTTVVMEPGMGRTQHAVNGGGDPFYTDGQVAVVILEQP